MSAEALPLLSRETALAWLEVLALQSLYATAIALLVLLIFGLFRPHHPLLRLGLWSLVLLRLVLPVDLAAPWSLRHSAESVWQTLPSNAPATPRFATFRDEKASTLPATALAPAPFITIPKRPATPILADGGQAASPTVVATPIPRIEMALGLDDAGAWRRHWPSALFILWLAGVLTLSLQYGTQWRRYRRHARQAQSIASGPLAVRIEQWRHHLQVRRPVRLVVGEALLSPFTMGLLKPVIYLPAALAKPGAEAALDAAIGHEMAHIRRCDDLWLKLETAVKIVYFFFPLVWLAGRQIDAAREELCDALALRHGRRAAKAYAHGLVAALRLTVGQRSGAPCPALDSAFASMRARLLRLSTLGQASRWGDARALITVALVAGCALPMAQASGDAPDGAAVADAFSAAEARPLTATPAPETAPAAPPLTAKSAPPPLAAPQPAPRSSVSVNVTGGTVEVTTEEGTKRYDFDTMGAEAAATARVELERALAEHGMQGKVMLRDGSMLEMHLNDDWEPAFEADMEALAEDMAKFKDFEWSRLQGLDADEWARRKEEIRERIAKAHERMREARARARDEKLKAQDEARRTMLRVERNIRTIIRNSQRDAMANAKAALAEVDRALAAIDWQALATLNEGLQARGEDIVDVDAILREAGVYDLRERIASALARAQEDALREVDRTLRSIESQSKHGSKR